MITENVAIEYSTALAADDAWQTALERAYGTNASNARYDDRGVATPELAALKAAFLVANDEWIGLCRQRRATNTT